MKLFAKFGWLSMGICAIGVPTIFSVTSCAKTNPYEKNKTGDTITIKSKQDANNCIVVAKEYIRTEPPQTWDSTNIGAQFKSFITNDKGSTPQGYAFASTQIYWELVYYMCNQYSKGTLSVRVTGDHINDNGSCIFVSDLTDDGTVKIISNASIVCEGFLSTYNAATSIGYAIPATTADHFTLNLGTNDKISSYGLWACSYNSSTSS